MIEPREIVPKPRRERREEAESHDKNEAITCTMIALLTYIEEGIGKCTRTSNDT
jgi:hypothetical protein